MPLKQFYRMKKIIIVLCLVFYGLAHAQQQDNPFMKSDQTEERVESVPETAEAPGPPGGDDLPIDDYIPLLVIVAMGMIVYNTMRKKTLS